MLVDGRRRLRKFNNNQIKNDAYAMLLNRQRQAMRRSLKSRKDLKVPSRTNIALAGSCGRMDKERLPVKALYLNLENQKS